ncbi:MAG: TIGR00730 family Rossman fold protein [Clostridia bacterium]|nr:TIGR00730 family Rossman fold protein [Clostridia bacterium]
MKICVFGAASAAIDKNFIDAAEKLGEEIARRGHSLVFGAGANGLMGAVARGVKRCGGNIIGVIPSFFKDENIEEIYDQCDELIFTDTMSKRIATMTELSDAFITVPGGVGTLEEFFEVFTLKQLTRHTKPIGIFDINNYYDKLDDFLKHSVEEKFIRYECKDLYAYSNNVYEILDYVENDKRAKKDVHDLKNG